MRDGRAEGTVLRPLRIDVDPLEVAGRFRELVDALVFFVFALCFEFVFEFVLI